MVVDSLDFCRKVVASFAKKYLETLRRPPVKGHRKREKAFLIISILYTNYTKRSAEV